MENQQTNNQQKMKLGLIVAGIVIFIAILSLAGIHLTSKPSFCKRCHSMEGVYNTWKMTTHKNIDCLACHSDPGVVGLAKAKLGGLHQLWVTVIGTTPEKIVAEVPNRRCVACHEKIPDSKNVKDSKLKKLTEKIKYDHYQHTKAIKKCTVCHSRVVHQEKPPTISKFKQNCLDCHVKKNVDDNKCSVCHKPYHKANYDIQHGKDALVKKQECLDCHVKKWEPGLRGVGPNYCQDCHKAEMPHKPQFLKIHGQEFVKNKESCKQCHNPEAVKKGSRAKTCIACHKVEMPHPKGFKDNHANESKKNLAACVSCHNTTNEKAGSKAQACATCHSKADIHPNNWKGVHGKESKKSKATCTTCHSSTSKLGFKAVSCQECHSKVNVHGSTWQGKHYSASKKSGATCTNCHSSEGKSLGFKAKTCNQCHNQGHQPGFIKVHESKYNQKVINCANCHKQGGIANQCISCHKQTMPHASTIKKTHGSLAKKNRNSCNYCHTPKNPVYPKASYAKQGYCTSCHPEGGGHPSNWLSPGIHSTAALKTNGNECAICHSVRPGGNPKAGWCYTCHQTNYKHPVGWSNPSSHGMAYLMKGDNACNLCHVKENDCLQCHGPRW